MPETVYKTQGTCSRSIKLKIENGIIESVEFVGCCDGNTKGIEKLVCKMDAKQAAEKLQGIKCGFKSTSCPDQLSKAIKQLLEEER